MPEYQYVARELSGEQVTGVLTANSEQDAVNVLTTRALFPLKIDIARSEKVRQKKHSRRIPTSHLAVVYAQLGDLLQAGVPLIRSLEILEQQSTRPALANVLKQVREEVADGTRLADAMRSHQRIFGELAVSMVRAGEEGGFLEDVLKRIAQFTEHQEELKNRVVGALFYPLFLVLMGTVVVTVLMVFFVPKFAPIFERLKERGELPIATSMLMGFSELVQNYGLVILALMAGGVWWLIRFAGSPHGKRQVDLWRLRTKGIGPIVRSLAIARFCRILGTLMRNGVPILPALRIAKDATGNQLLSEAVSAAAENISSGKALARPLAQSGEFPVEVVEMIAVGEEANNLEQVLLNISENLERRTYRQLELFVRLLEPLMLLMMAIVILFLVVALLLPVFQSAGAL